MQKSESNTIVFMPGWGFSANIWRDIASTYSYADTCLLDLPVITSKTTLHEIAHQLFYLIPKNSSLVGWSLSGLLGIIFCALYPGHCRQLILTASTPRFMIDDEWGGIENQQGHDFFANAKSDPDRLKAEFNRIVCFPDRNLAHRRFILSHSLFCDLNYLNILLNTDARIEYQALNLPIHIIQGNQDAIVSTKNIMLLKELNLNTTATIIEDAGHSLFVTHQSIYLNNLRRVITDV